MSKSRNSTRPSEIPALTTAVPAVEGQANVPPSPEHPLFYQQHRDKVTVMTIPVADGKGKSLSSKGKG